MRGVIGVGASMAGHMQKLIDFSADHAPCDPPPSVEPRVLARRSDPDTSHDAAEQVADKAGRLEMVFLRTLRRMGRVASAYEVAAAQTEWSNDQTIRKRAGGLKKKGLIRRVDRDGITPDGSACERFELTDEGRSLLNEFHNKQGG